MSAVEIGESSVAGEWFTNPTSAELALRGGCCLCGRGHIKGITLATFTLVTLIDSMNEVRGYKTFQQDFEILTTKMGMPTTTYTNITTALKEDLMLEFQNRMNALDVNDSFYRLCRNDSDECYLGCLLYKAQKRLQQASVTRLTASSSAVADSQPIMTSKKQLQVQKQRGLCILASLQLQHCCINLNKMSREVAISPDMLPFAMRFCAEHNFNIALEIDHVVCSSCYMNMVHIKNNCVLDGKHLDVLSYCEQLKTLKRQNPTALNTQQRIHLALLMEIIMFGFVKYDKAVELIEDELYFKKDTAQRHAAQYFHKADKNETPLHKIVADLALYTTTSPSNCSGCTKESLDLSKSYLCWNQYNPVQAASMAPSPPVDLLVSEEAKAAAYELVAQDLVKEAMRRKLDGWDKYPLAPEESAKLFTNIPPGIFRLVKALMKGNTEYSEQERVFLMGNLANVIGRIVSKHAVLPMQVEQGIVIKHAEDALALKMTHLAGLTSSKMQLYRWIGIVGRKEKPEKPLTDNTFQSSGYGPFKVYKDHESGDLHMSVVLTVGDNAQRQLTNEYRQKSAYLLAISCILWVVNIKLTSSTRSPIVEGDILFPLNFHNEVIGQLVPSNIDAFRPRMDQMELLFSLYAVVLHRNETACKGSDDGDDDVLHCLEHIVKQGSDSTDSVLQQLTNVLYGDRLRLSFDPNIQHMCDATMRLRNQFLLPLTTKSAGDMKKYAKELYDLLPNNNGSLRPTVGDYEVLWHLQMMQYRAGGGKQQFATAEEDGDGDVIPQVTAPIHDSSLDENGEESIEAVENEGDDDVVIELPPSEMSAEGDRDISNASSIAGSSRVSPTAAATVAASEVSTEDAFVHGLITFPALWHFLFHAAMLLLHMYGGDILGPINALLVEEGSDDLQKIVTWQHMHHIIGVAVDAIQRELFAIFEAEKRIPEQRTGWIFDIKEYKLWLLTANEKPFRNERTIAHYAGFVRNGYVYLTMYFSARRGNAELFHECVAHFGVYFSLLGKTKYFKLFLYTLALIRAMNPFQREVFRTFFACSLNADFDRMVVADESLECSLNKDFKEVMKGSDIETINENIGYLAYVRPAEKMASKMCGMAPRVIRYNRHKARDKDIRIVIDQNILHVLHPRPPPLPLSAAVPSAPAAAVATALAAASSSSGSNIVPVDGDFLQETEEHEEGSSSRQQPTGLLIAQEVVAEAVNAADNDCITTLGNLNAPYKYFHVLLHSETIQTAVLSEALHTCSQELSRTTYDTPIRLKNLESRRLTTFTAVQNDKKKMAKLLLQQKKRALDSIIKIVEAKYQKSLRSTMTLADIEVALRPLCLCYLNTSGDLNQGQKSKLMAYLSDKLHIKLLTDTQRDRTWAILLDLCMPLHGGLFMGRGVTNHAQLNTSIVNWVKNEVFNRCPNLHTLYLEYDAKSLIPLTKGPTQEKRIKEEFLTADQALTGSLLDNMCSSKASWLKSLENRTLRDVVVFLFCKWLLDHSSPNTPHCALKFLKKGQIIRISGVAWCDFSNDSVGSSRFIGRSDTLVHDYVCTCLDDNGTVVVKQVPMEFMIGEGEVRMVRRALLLSDLKPPDTLTELWGDDTDILALIMIARSFAPIRLQAQYEAPDSLFESIYIRHKSTQRDSANSRLFSCSSMIESVCKSDIWLIGMDNSTKLIMFVWLWMISGIDFVYARNGFGFYTNLEIAQKMLLELVIDPRAVRDLMLSTVESSSSASQPPQIHDNFAHLFVAFSYLLKQTKSNLVRRFAVFITDGGQLREGEEVITAVRIKQMEENNEVKSNLCPSVQSNFMVNSLSNHTLAYWFHSLFEENGQCPNNLPAGLIVCDPQDASSAVGRKYILELSSCISRVGGVTKFRKCTCYSNQHGLCCSTGCECNSCTILCNCMADNGVCVNHGAKVTAEGPDYYNRTCINAMRGAVGKKMLIARCQQMQVNYSDAAGKPMGIDALRDIVLSLIPQQQRSSSSSAAALSVGISHALSTLQTPICSPTDVGVATPAESQAIIATGDETTLIVNVNCVGKGKRTRNGVQLQFNSPTTNSSTTGTSKHKDSSNRGRERKRQAVSGGGNPEVVEEEEEGHGIMDECL